MTITNFDINAFFDGVSTENITDQKSQLGFLEYLGTTLMSWNSNKQLAVTGSYELLQY